MWKQIEDRRLRTNESGYCKRVLSHVHGKSNISEEPDSVSNHYKGLREMVNGYEVSEVICEEI